ncbi:MAG: hypothetical protein KAS47_01870 [Candidatus Heimdallarchaeota archaeon]|nr:hypothetical protein [Candidatus Heimdallarchaeota archaeon]MCK4971784.1 hypothetical protein [Candidatus Heimdallarchaeota archaeon]MCK5140847.1 hypothetical protein [Candidatus Heimdallarchaeota archaeon]
MDKRIVIDIIEEKLQTVSSNEQMKEIVADLRIVISNNRSTLELMETTKKAIIIALELGYNKDLTNLYGLLILQLEHREENLGEVSSLIKKMQQLTKNTGYQEGIALTYAYLWYHEKIKGNKKQSKDAILKAKKIFENLQEYDNYNYYFVLYSYAIEIWLHNHDSQSTKLLEECANFFYREGYHRSLAQTFGLLSVMYTRTHEGKRALNMSNIVLTNRSLFENLPLDVKGIIYYFTGLGHMLDANLAIAESYFNETYNILKPIYKDSIYFAYYLVLLSYLATVRGLQGKTEQVTDIVKEADKLLQTEFIKKNLDENSKKQITHTHNLTKFYNLSRLSNYNSQKHQKLIEEIYEGCKIHYSDFMTLSEFILNSNLDSDKIQSLLSIDNFSINRVKHLIEFLLEKETLETEVNQEQIALKCISILEKRVITSKTTFMESVYTDLLIAQQLFSLKRYSEIAPRLKQYESRLKRIEVLEIRIFMEAFIQVGAYKSGDPLGPALQYMAIKKCRLYGFSRLENTLLKYLQLQHKDIRRTV